MSSKITNHRSNWKGERKNLFLRIHPKLHEELKILAVMAHKNLNDYVVDTLIKKSTFSVRK
jgi:predicted HicB family RNase H-like nuclease